jgi:hypothetical protein
VRGRAKGGSKANMKKENDRKILSVILDVLSRHEGKGNAIKRLDLLWLLGGRPEFAGLSDPDRAMRKAIQESGRILTSAKGYYLPADPVNDPIEAINYLRKKNNGMFLHIARIRNAYPHAGQGEQKEIPFR